MTQTIQEKQRLHTEILSLLNPSDIYEYKNTLYINKQGLRKISLAYNLSLSVSDNTITETLFISTVRVSDTTGRHIEASASQRLTEDALFDIEKAQSRASNRSIYDFYSLQELDLSWIKGAWSQISQKQTQKIQERTTPHTRAKWNYRAISPKQKSYLKRLIGNDDSWSSYHQELIQSLDDLSMHEAGKLIHEMLQDTETTTA